MNSRVFAGFSQCPGKNPTNPSLNVEASVEPLESCDLRQLDPNTNKLPRHWQQTAASPMPPTEQRWEYGLHAGYSPYFTMGWEMPPKLPLLPGASEPPSNTPFLVPSHVHIPNSILIGSSVSAQLRAVTDRQTYRTSATVGRIWCQTIAIVVLALSQQHCEMAGERVTEDWCRWQSSCGWASSSSSSIVQLDWTVARLTDAHRLHYTQPMNLRLIVATSTLTHTHTAPVSASFTTDTQTTAISK